MYDKELYRQVLGVEYPWYVVDVRLIMEEDSIYVYLKESSDALWFCPKCGEPVSVYDHRKERKWRHLDTCQFKTFIVASVPRICCKEHGVLSVDVPWSESHSHFTFLFESLAINLLFATQVQAKTAKLLRLSAGQVHDIMERAVNRGLNRRDKSELIEHLSIDEKSFQKGHHYITVLGDSVGGSVLDVCETRTKEAANALLKKTLTKAQQSNILSITMDMWEAFMNAAKEVIAKADIIHDRFHLAKYLNDAVDKTRQAENRTLQKNDCSTLKNSKYLWLKRTDDFTNAQSERFAELREQDLATAKVWSFKETFRSFFDCKTIEEGKDFFSSWYNEALALGSYHLTKVAKLLNRHIEGLLTYIKHRRTNAIAEGLNSRIQHIKSCAHGFRKFENYRIAILFFLGKLQLYPHKSS